jgi:AcrR family transcriptional regulator
MRPVCPIANSTGQVFGKGLAVAVKDRKGDRRSRRSRRLIVDALLALMLEKRFDRITVQEIIDRADVGRTTFYAQFRNKEHVLESELGRVFAQLHEQHGTTAGAPAEPLLPSLGIFRHVQETQPLYPAVIRGLASDPHYLTVHRLLRDQAARQLARATSDRELAVPPEIVADYLAGALLTLVHWWLDHGCRTRRSRWRCSSSSSCSPVSGRCCSTRSLDCVGLPAAAVALRAINPPGANEGIN